MTCPAHDPRSYRIGQLHQASDQVPDYELFLRICWSCQAVELRSPSKEQGVWKAVVVRPGDGEQRELGL